MPKKKKAPKGASMIPGFERLLDGAGPRRDKTILDAEEKALGITKKPKPKKKKKKADYAKYPM